MKKRTLQSLILGIAIGVAAGRLYVRLRQRRVAPDERPRVVRQLPRHEREYQ